MTEPRMDERPEKLEKEEEKEEEKHTEKDEKSWDEKWRRDPLSSAIFAVVLIWAGLVLMGENMGLLGALRPLGAWDLIFTGAGVLVLLAAAIRVMVPSYRRPVAGTVVIGLVLLAIGLGDVFGAGTVWALALIILGLGLLIRGLARR